MNLSYEMYRGYKIVCQDGMWQCIDLDLFTYPDKASLCADIDKFISEYNEFLDDYYLQNIS